MYVVRHKTSKKVLHVNPAPLSQALAGKDVYFRFDPETMEVGRSDKTALPEQFDIAADGGIDPVVRAPAHPGGSSSAPARPPAAPALPVPELTAEQKVAAGLLKLAKHEKILANSIVPKTRAELARDGLVSLAPDEEIAGDQIVRLTPRQLLNKKRYNLQRFKQAVIDQHSQACLDARRKVLQDHDLLYAAIGAVGPERVEECRTIVASFVQALDKAKAAIRKAKTADEVENVPMQYEQGPAPASPPRKPGRREPR